VAGAAVAVGVTFRGAFEPVPLGLVTLAAAIGPRSSCLIRPVP